MAVPPRKGAPGCAEATPLQPENMAEKARTAAPATQAVLVTVETIRRPRPASDRFRHRHNEPTKIAADAAEKPYPGVPARWRMLRKATAMIVFVGFCAPDVTNDAPSAT